MGFIRSFKATRRLPYRTDILQPGFCLERFPLMRRLQTARQIITMLPTFQPYCTIFVPGNAWAESHELWVRIFWKVDDLGLPLPPGTNVHEQGIQSPTNGVLNMSLAPYPAAPGIFEGIITRRLLRLAGDIWYYDDDDTSGLIGFAAKTGATSGQKWLPAAGSFDFTSPMSFDFRVKDAGTPYPITYTITNVIALIQAPLNLRTI